jgi:hypothetical protein
MDIEHIVNRAVTDEKFAAELAKQAAGAAAAGVHSEIWREYVNQFADTPEELEELLPPENAARTRWTTITTLTTVTTAGCATTTTTTTTTEVPRLCNPKNIGVEVAGEVVFPLAGIPIKTNKSFKDRRS